MVNPLPTIALDGSFLTTVETTDTDGRNVLYDDRPTVIGRMTVDWGRTDQWTQPAPAVFTFTLWEPADLATTWLKKIVAGTSLRRGCTLTYTKPAGGLNPGTKTAFQGFTTNVDVERQAMRTKRGMTDGWLVQIQASDRSAFVGQENWGAQTLPRETMQSRAVRIRNQAGPTGIREFYFEDRFKDGYVNPLDVTDRSVMDTANGMYQSFADQWTYQQHRNVVIRIPGGSNWGAYYLRFGVSTGDNAVRLYPPNWVDPTGQEQPIDQQAYPAGYIGACDVSGRIALSSTALNDITDISCNWHDAITNPPAGNAWVSSLNVTNSVPRNRLKFDSWYENGTDIDPILQDVKNTVQKDGARPCHPPIRWDTAKAGDIPDWQTFESLSLASQTIRMVVLAGSPFSAATGNAPVWHPNGGVIAYEKGKWDLTVHLQPTEINLPAGWTPVTCATVHQSITLGDTSTRYLDPSITPFDIYYVRSTDAGVYAYN